MHFVLSSFSACSKISVSEFSLFTWSGITSQNKNIVRPNTSNALGVVRAIGVGKRVKTIALSPLLTVNQSEKFHDNIYEKWTKVMRQIRIFVFFIFWLFSTGFYLKSSSGKRGSFNRFLRVDMLSKRSNQKLTRDITYSFIVWQLFSTIQVSSNDRHWTLHLRGLC